MNRKNLATGLLATVLLFSGVAWTGEFTHYHPPAPPPRPPIVIDTPPLPEDPDKPVEVEKEETPPEKRREDLAPPDIPDNPVTPRSDDFRQEVEPLRPPSESPGQVRIPEISGGMGGGQRVFDPGQLSQQPVARYQARPDYPYEMKRDGRTGEVLVDFIVDTNGNVRRAFAARSSSPEFEEAACRAVARWKFKPGRRGGVPVFVHMQVPIVFSLNEGE